MTKQNAVARVPRSRKKPETFDARKERIVAWVDSDVSSSHSRSHNMTVLEA